MSAEHHQKNLLLNAVKLALGIFLLVLSFWRVDWSLFYQVVQEIKFIWFLAAIGSVLLGLVLKVYRWQILLKHYNIHLSSRRLFSAYFLGQAANILLFVRGGEFVRVGLAHQKKNEDIPDIVISIGLEKYLDLAMLVLLSLILAAILPVEFSARYSNLIQLFFIISVILLLLLIFLPALGQKVFNRNASSLKWKNFFEKINLILQNSLWLRNPRHFLSLGALSFATWIVMGATNLFLFKALSLHVSWQAAGLVLILVFIGVLPALMPGNIGPFTYFAQLALAPFNVPSSPALAFALLLYVIVTLPPLLIAAGFLLGSTKKSLVDGLTSRKKISD